MAMTTLEHVFLCYWILCLIKIAVMVARYWRDLADDMANFNRRKADGRFSDRWLTLAAVAALFALAPVLPIVSLAIKAGVLPPMRRRSYRNTVEKETGTP